MLNAKDQRFDVGIKPPLTFPVTEIPTKPNTLHSPLIGQSHGIKPFDYSKYVSYLNEVIDVRLQCASNQFPVDFMKRHYPKSWGPYSGPEFSWPEFFTQAGIDWQDGESCIAAVRMDTPVDLGLFILRWLRDKGSLKVKTEHKHTPFLETFPKALETMTDYINTALKKCFEVKYFYGVARPEQMYEYVYGKDRGNITAYPAPIHPSYAAGHSAAAAATAVFFRDYFELDSADWIMIRLGAYYFGQFRTMAGVHYAVDNLAGFQIGGLDVGYQELQSV